MKGLHRADDGVVAVRRSRGASIFSVLVPRKVKPKPRASDWLALRVDSVALLLKSRIKNASP
jgi:hypothetical protein